MKDLFLRHKKTLIISTILCLLPILFGVILWDRLPDPMPTHFDASGTPDGWSSKYFAVIGLPLIMLAVQWICLLATSADPKRRNINAKVLTLVLWTIPLITLISMGATYAIALGMDVNITQLLYPFFGLLFIFIGNYLPKCRQSYTMGIKLPWTLANEENWNKTHRMAGPLWMICGLPVLICGLLPRSIALPLFFAALFTATLVPVIYSYLLAKKQGLI
ncbi:MAG: SdpI family protein [Clostridia bacterium]|nr:SdpI family protein [Clostridia bacterium]